MANIVQKPGSAHVGVHITGWQDISAQLDRLPIQVRGPELERGIRKSLNKIKTRARQLVPRPGYLGDKPGKKPLRDTIGVVIRRYKGGAVIGGVVGPEYPAGAHGHLVEAGTKPHKIKVKNKKVLANKELSNTLAFDIFGKDVNHPGAKPKPFMEPAVKDVAPEIESTIIEHLRKAVDKATRGG